MTARTPSVCTNDILASVREGRSIARFKKGESVFCQGDNADAVYFIESGTLKLTVVSEQGKEAVVAYLQANEFFGEACLTSAPQRLASARAMTESIIARLEKGTISRLLVQDPLFRQMFIAHLLARTIRVEADLVDQLFNSSEKRLARLLLLLANFGKDEKPEPILASISQATLAEMIGTTRSRVSFFMNKFRNLGYIDYDGRIEVHCSLLNAVLLDDPHLSRRETE